MSYFDESVKNIKSNAFNPVQAYNEQAEKLEARPQTNYWADMLTGIGTKLLNPSNPRGGFIGALGEGIAHGADLHKQSVKQTDLNKEKAMQLRMLAIQTQQNLQSYEDSREDRAFNKRMKEQELGLKAQEVGIHADKNQIEREKFYREAIGKRNTELEKIKNKGLILKSALGEANSFIKSSKGWFGGHDSKELEKINQYLPKDLEVRKDMSLEQYKNLLSKYWNASQIMADPQKYMEKRNQEMGGNVSDAELINILKNDLSQLGVSFGEK